MSARTQRQQAQAAEVLRAVRADIERAEHWMRTARVALARGEILDASDSLDVCTRRIVQAQDALRSVQGGVA